jgi:hypothetical protein
MSAKEETMRSANPFSIAAVGIIAALALAACAPSPGNVDQGVNATLTALAAQPSATPIIVASATHAPSPSPLPPTTTPTATPTPTATQLTITPPADDPVLLLGKPDDVDNFDNDGNWPVYPPGDNDCFSSEIKDGKLWMTAEGRTGLSCWELSWPQLGNFYIELTLQMPQPCDANDRFGLLFRAPDNFTGYLYGITCGGVQTFTAWTGSETLQILPAARSDAILTAPGATNRIGIMADDKSFKFYINGIKVAEGLDETFKDAGKIGLYVNAGTDQGFTLGFDRLATWNLPRPTTTVTPTP